MLPFLKKKNETGISGVMIKHRTPDEKPEETTEDDKDAAIHACAQDLIDAVHAQDVKGAAEAIRSAFEILESMPHEEAEHTSPHSYEAQNIQAAKE